MKKIILFIFLFSFILKIFSQIKDPVAYRLFDSKGNQIDFNTFLQKCKNVEVVLFGEFHDNPVIHWLQYETLEKLFETSPKKLIIGAEMFETDVQIIIDEYMNGLCREKNFLQEARPWTNYETDYKPIVEFAKKKKIRFIATNIPRRYAALVNVKGFEELYKLSDEAKRYIAPLPIPYDSSLSCYSKISFVNEEMPGMAASMHNKNNLAKAQAIKDATMAYNIAKNLSKDHLFFHLHGAYHSDFYEGIVWYLKKYKPDVSFIVISPLITEDASKPNEEDLKRGDIIISVNKNVNRSYK